MGQHCQDSTQSRSPDVEAGFVECWPER